MVTRNYDFGSLDGVETEINIKAAIPEDTEIEVQYRRNDQTEDGDVDSNL